MCYHQPKSSPSPIPKIPNSLSLFKTGNCRQIGELSTFNQALLGKWLLWFGFDFNQAPLGIVADWGLNGNICGVWVLRGVCGWSTEKILVLRGVSLSKYISSKWDIFCKNISFAYEWVFGMVLNWWEDCCLKNMFLELYGITEDEMPHLHLIWIKGVVRTLNSLDRHKIGSLSLWKISLNCWTAALGQRLG